MPTQKIDACVLRTYNFYAVFNHADLVSNVRAFIASLNLRLSDSHVFFQRELIPVAEADTMMSQTYNSINMYVIDEVP